MTTKPSHPQKKNSWFYRWFLNNKVTIVLINLLLFLAVIWVFANVSWIFQPVGTFLSMILPPVLVAGILYYLIEPLIELMEKKLKVPRLVMIILIFALIIGLVIWGVVSLIPVIQEQTAQIVKNWPAYWQNLGNGINDLLRNPDLITIRNRLSEQISEVTSAMTSQLNQSVSDWLTNISSAVGVAANVILVIVTAPFILFFMLKDGPKFKPYILQFVPPKFRQATGDLLTEVNSSLSNYIRGQLTVAFWVAVMFSVGYSLIGQKYALTLGVLAGFLNLIPYLGSFLAIIPAVIIGAFTSSLMVVKVLIVFMIEQTIEGRFVSPLVVGNKMAMHPATTLLILLAAGKMFGLLGVLLGIPVYAVIKILVSRLFVWFRTVSGLYEADLAAESSGRQTTPPIKQQPDTDVSGSDQNLSGRLSDKKQHPKTKDQKQEH